MRITLGLRDDRDSDPVVLEDGDGPGFEVFGSRADRRRWARELWEASGGKVETEISMDPLGDARTEAEDWCVRMLREFSGDENLKLAANWLEHQIGKERSRRG